MGIVVAAQGEVTWLRMQAGKANALDVAFCEALTRVLTEAEASDARALVLTGQGRIFSAGVDLKQLVEGGDDYIRAFLRALRDAFTALFTCRLPVVAAVNGHAIAGGCVLTAACDHRLMAKASGRIGLPELIVGVPFPVIALEIMRAALAPAVLQDAVFGGENRTPEEAVAQGFVDALVTPDALEREAQEAAERLARIPTRNFTLTKRAVRAPFLRNVAHAREALDPKIDAQWHAPETLEAVRRFVEKTLPA